MYHFVIPDRDKTMRFSICLAVALCFGISIIEPYQGNAQGSSGGQKDKAQEEYQKHVKEAEQAHKKQEREQKNALFKSNVRKALEKGHARHH